MNMNHFLMRAFVLLAACASFNVTAFALDDAEYRQFMKNQEFRAADKELGDAWRKAKSTMPPSQFEVLRREQRAWVSAKRDVDAKEYIAVGYPRVEAYAIATRARAAWLSERAELASLIEAADGVQGAYVRRLEGQPATLKVRWVNRQSGTISVEAEAELVLSPVNVRTGVYVGEGALKRGVFRDEAGVTVRFNGDSVTIETTDAFKMSGEMGMGVVIDGVYVPME